MSIELSLHPCSTSVKRLYLYKYRLIKHFSIRVVITDPLIFPLHSIKSICSDRFKKSFSLQPLIHIDVLGTIQRLLSCLTVLWNVLKRKFQLVITSSTVVVKVTCCPPYIYKLSCVHFFQKSYEKKHGFLVSRWLLTYLLNDIHKSYLIICGQFCSLHRILL